MTKFFLKTISLLVVMLWCGIMSAQLDNVTLKKSDIVKAKNKRNAIFFMAEDSLGGVFTGRAYKKGYEIEHYDTDMNLIESYDIEVKDTKIKAAFVKNGQLNIIKCYRNKKSKSYEYSVLQSPIKKLNFSEKTLFQVPFTDLTMPWKMEFDFFTASNYKVLDLVNPTGEFMITKNKKYITVYLDLREEKKENDEKHLLKVYDGNYNLIFEKEFNSEYKDKNFQLNSVYTNENTGTVYYTGKIFDEEGDKDDKESYHHKIYEVRSSGVRELAISDKDFFINQVRLFSRENTLIAVGMFSDKEHGHYKGVVYYELDAQSFEVKSTVFNPFTKDFMIEKYGEKRADKKMEKGTKKLDIRGIFIDKEGNIVLATEEEFVMKMVDGFSYGGPRYSYTYFHNDIVLCKLNTKGELIWAKNVKKTQTSQNRHVLDSYFATIKNGNIYIFVNGKSDIYNEKRDRIEIYTTDASRISLYVLQIDPDGKKMTYRKLADRKDDFKFNVVHAKSIQNNSEVLLEGIHRKERSLIKVSLN